MSSSSLAGPAAAALESLTAAQLAFIQSLAKAELHAHLNGCLPLLILQTMASEYTSDAPQAKIVQDGIAKLQTGVILDQIHDFFWLFPAIYALTSNPSNMRSTPRATDTMTRREYLTAVLDEVERYPVQRAALIVSLDRRMAAEDLQECVDLACVLRAEVLSTQISVVGIDLCGDPRAGDMEILREYLVMAKNTGLGITLHIAEVGRSGPSSEETLQLLSYFPQRLGHATFLDEAAKTIVRENKMCIEICLSSNILCKTTDNTLPFRTTTDSEYALLLATPPLGLGLSEDEVRRVAEMGMAVRFH
ncbi:Metallo-dependent hydrolase [Mycena amicta]|nr:Metallo-dependent hydrolase [Mycena amicta]